MKRIPKLNLQLHSEKKRYYSLYQEGSEANIYIYGDITSWPWLESDVSSYTLSKELQELKDVENINVYISSYGGEVKEGLAIYKALKRHKAKVTTIADGFACSIASVIYAAGDERIISDIDLLMIHNAWTYTAGDSNDLRKQADELEKMTQRSINAYMDIVNIEEDELKALMNTDTWIDGAEALEMGFATKLVKSTEKETATQSVRKTLMQRIKEEPKKAAVANVKIDENQMKGIVQKAMEEFKQQLKEQGVLKEPEEETPEEKEIEKPQQTTNKPINMMRAFFNLKEEE
ncbi:Clp protease ClpP [Tissierella pigra]|uniref:head maturation protease, ClpP-related n=1 Tax=Tissierella pigra TaxID=2607614 RepID=UPI001C10F40E|nr:Clp protease ClpP [Tissierella pigra]